MLEQSTTLQRIFFLVPFLLLLTLPLIIFWQFWDTLNKYSWVKNQIIWNWVNQHLSTFFIRCNWRSKIKLLTTKKVFMSSTRKICHQSKKIFQQKCINKVWQRCKYSREVRWNFYETNQSSDEKKIGFQMRCGLATLKNSPREF